MEFLSYFGGVFEPVAFMLLLVGTIGGLILGATPGLSPTMAVALLIPFTFQLTPVQGLILLGAAYTSTVAGGAVSAILLKIPGAPANIATALDGNEMARRGEGARALHGRLAHVICDALGREADVRQRRHSYFFP